MISFLSTSLTDLILTYFPDDAVLLLDVYAIIFEKCMEREATADLEE